ncbi:MAG TPA: ArsC/Spx/MgsR family protein [Candidatus Binatia bacterium]|nr:ArsC/Spx/MgsR family protein [Candidatus Binatia bacterium]
MRERGVEFDVIEYLKTPLDRAGLERIMDMLPNPPADLVRKDKNFEALGLDANHYVTREAVIDLLLQHPVLMQRPIIIKGKKAVLARPSEKVLELL